MIEVIEFRGKQYLVKPFTCRVNKVHCGVILLTSIGAVTDATPLSWVYSIHATPLSWVYPKHAHAAIVGLSYTCHAAAVDLSYTCHAAVVDLSYTCHAAVVDLSYTCHAAVVDHCMHAGRMELNKMIFRFVYDTFSNVIEVL